MQNYDVILIRLYFFIFNDTATTEIYTLSLHDALPISGVDFAQRQGVAGRRSAFHEGPRSEEHTSELQSRENIVCRLLLEKKKENMLCFIVYSSDCRSDCCADNDNLS